jgi:hypothetical protein
MKDGVKEGNNSARKRLDAEKAGGKGSPCLPKGAGYPTQCIYGANQQSMASPRRGFNRLQQHRHRHRARLGITPASSILAILAILRFIAFLFVIFKNLPSQQCVHLTENH